VRIISVAEFAREMGVTDPAIWIAIKKKRLLKGVVERNGKTAIDADIAAKEYHRSQPHPLKSPAPKSKQKQATPPTPSPAGGVPATAAPAEPRRVIIEKPRDVDPGQEMASYHDARAMREAYDARMSKLEYQKELGKLVPVEDVQKQAAQVAKTVRDALLSIPARIAAEVANEIDVWKVEIMLDKEIRGALEELTRLPAFKPEEF